MTVKEAAAELGVSASLVYKLMRLERLAYTQICGRKLPDDDAVRAFKERNFHPEKCEEAMVVNPIVFKHYRPPRKRGPRKVT